MSSRTILVADEDPDTRIILRALLERHGFNVVEAANGLLARDAANQAVSLVILNHPLYVSLNVSLAAWLRSHPETQNVPIINLTSRAVPAYLHEASAQGVTVSLPKPIDVQKMLHLVDELTTAVPA